MAIGTSKHMIYLHIPFIYIASVYYNEANNICIIDRSVNNVEIM